MEYLSNILQSFLLSVSTLFGAETSVQQKPIVTLPQQSAEVRKQDEAQSIEDEALGEALTQLRNVRERLKEPEVVEGMPVQMPKRVPPKAKTPPQTQQQGTQTNNTPSFVKPVTTSPQKSTSQPASSSPQATSFDPTQPIGSILLDPRPHQNIELAYREVPAGIGTHYELEWNIPDTLTCSIIIFRYKTDSQISSTWMKSVVGKGKKNTDPLYQDQRYRLLCKNSKGIYHADTILFRTQSMVRALPTCSIGVSKGYAAEGETITYTIGGSDIETFAFGNTRPVVPEGTLRFPFTHTAVLRAGAEPFTVTVGNRLGTSTCNAIVKIRPPEEVPSQ